MHFTTIVISGPTVTLTQPSAAVPQSVLEMSYDKPDDNPLRDLAGNAVETIQGWNLPRAQRRAGVPQRDDHAERGREHGLRPERGQPGGGHGRPTPGTP